MTNYPPVVSEKIQLKLDYKNPLKVAELGDALKLIDSSFNLYAREFYHMKRGFADLSISEVRKGSIEIDFIAATAGGLLPIFEYGKVAIEFGKFWISTYDFFAGKTQVKPLNARIAQNLGTAAVSFAGDGNKLNIGVLNVYNTNVCVGNYGSKELQDICVAASEETRNELFTNQRLELIQLRETADRNSGFR